MVLYITRTGFAMKGWTTMGCTGSNGG